MPRTSSKLNASYSSIARSVSTIRQLFGDDVRRARMRAATEDYTWRHHTWADRISHLLVKVTDLPITRNGYILRAAATMWDQRARQLGPRAVGHIRWTKEKFWLRAELADLATSCSEDARNTSPSSRG